MYADSRQRTALLGDKVYAPGGSTVAANLNKYPVPNAPMQPVSGGQWSTLPAQTPLPPFVASRRRMLWMPALAAAGVIAGRISRVVGDDYPPNPQPAEDSTSPNTATGPLEWKDFLHRSALIAEELYADDSPQGEDAYLYAMASLAVRITSVPECELEPFPGMHPEVRFGISHRGFPFNVVQWRMEPHAVVAPHCHPNASVCTVGLEGECNVRHYEIDGPAPRFDSGSAETFSIRETRRQIIAPRDVSTLSRSRDNIHCLQAGPKGARGIDITTARGGDGTFSFMHIEPQKAACSTAQDTFNARWIGMAP